MIKFFTRALLPLRNDKRGVTIIEYALLAGLIAVAAVATIGSIGGKVSTIFTSINTSI